MARKQRRRTVSLSRDLYDATVALATARGLSVSHLCELALLAYGVQAKPGRHFTPAFAAVAQFCKSAVWKGESK